MHDSVLLRESVDALGVKLGGVYIDATVGMGGHALEILRRGGEVIGMDADKQMLDRAELRLKDYCKKNACPSFKLLHANYSYLSKIIDRSVNGVIFDLGISSVHLDGLGRGFSFRDSEAGLDMRLNPEAQNVTAADLLNGLNSKQLLELFSETLRYQEATRLVAAITLYKKQKKIETVGDLLKIVEESRLIRRGINPATRPMLALRIAVNTEMENIENGLQGAFEKVVAGGRIVAISFHSGEDRVVKRVFRKFVDHGDGRVIGKPVIPSYEEVGRNERARSAKMRIIEKI